MKNSLFTFLVFFQLNVFAQHIISGEVIDVKSGEPLPFASIGFEGSFIGTTTNAQGEFELKYPDQLVGHPLVFSFLGYRSHSIAASDSDTRLKVQLVPITIELKEVIIHPLSPIDYLKRAIRKIPENYPRDPFESIGYYREQIKENGEFLKLTEAIFRSYYPAYQDTLKNQHQVLLYRQKKDVKKLSFMRDEIEKAQEKDARESKKDGNPVEEEDLDESIVESNFGGPDAILSQDIVKEQQKFLDSTQFKSFKYEFGGASSYMGKDLLVIEFKSRGKVEHMRQEGKVYLDINSDAIVAIEFRGKIVIPFIVRPILFALGFDIDHPFFEQRLRYQHHDGRWYPENFQWKVNVELTKRHLFSSNDNSKFEIAQVFTVTGMKVENIVPIEQERVFNKNKDMKDQVFHDIELSWSDVNVIQPDPLLSTSEK